MLQSHGSLSTNFPGKPDRRKRDRDCCGLLKCMLSALKQMPSELAAACNAVLNTPSNFHPFKVISASLAQLLQSEQPMSVHSRSHLKMLADGVAAHFDSPEARGDVVDDKDMTHILCTLTHFNDDFEMSVLKV
jgi:hypothetical protein